MEGMEAKVNLSQIEKEFSQGLRDAETQNGPHSSSSESAVPPKSTVNVPPIVARLITDFKNFLEAKIISKDMDEDTKFFVRECLKTTPEEVTFYKGVFDMLGTEVAPENYKEFLNKWLTNPMIACSAMIIEHETQRMIKLRTQLKLREVASKV